VTSGGSSRTAARLDRLSACPWARASLGRGDRRDARRHRRPDHAADADGAPGRTDGRAPPPFGDFERATRSHTLPFATASTQAILITARALLATATPLIEQRGITLVGCSVAMLEDARTRQLLLGRRRQSTPPSTRSATVTAARRSRALSCSAATGLLYAVAAGLRIPA
jgi:hypothetical protein